MFDDDVIELNFDDSPLGDGGGGMGMEFLMNDKMRSSNSQPAKSFNGDIDLSDLDTLEKELKMEDSGIGSGSGSGSNSNSNSNSFFGNLFGSGSGSGGSKVGESSANLEANNKTWDGYGRLNSTSIDPDMNLPVASSNLSKEETMKRKMKRLYDLEQMERKGVTLTKKYTMDSSLQEMDAEYSLHHEERLKKNSVKMMGQTMLTIVNTLEWLNTKFDPFDLKLDGLGEQVNDNMNDYDPIFEELHEKYKDSVTVIPEVKLLYTFAGQAAMLHMMNSMASAFAPGMDDIMRENPDLMKAFQSATLNTMQKKNPQSSFGGFMNNIMGNSPSPSPQAPVFQGGPPPAPIKTQGPGSMPPPPRPGVPRMDINMARNQDGEDLRDMFTQMAPPLPPRKRPEMKGPVANDVNDILSGLKLKTVSPVTDKPLSMGSMMSSANSFDNSLQAQQQQDIMFDNDPIKSLSLDDDEFSPMMSEDLNNSSTISIKDLRDLQANGTANMPKKSKRNKSGSGSKSDRGTTISLDL